MVKVKALVKGGEAKPKPPLAPQLAAAKVDIGKVIDAINEKTKDFNGMEVPVTVEVDPSTKEFKISVGSPSVAALIRKELDVEKLAKAPFNVFEKEGIKEEFKKSLTFDQVVKIARMKFDDLKTANFKKAVKQVVGFCVSAGCYIEEKKPKEIVKEIDEGKWDEKIQ